MADADESRPPATSCPGCGRVRSTADASGLAWSSRHTRDGVEFVCPTCTRADLALIEAGLPLPA